MHFGFNVDLTKINCQNIKETKFQIFVILAPHFGQKSQCKSKVFVAKNTKEILKVKKYSKLDIPVTVNINQ